MFVCNQYLKGYRVFGRPVSFFDQKRNKNTCTKHPYIKYMTEILVLTLHEQHGFLPQAVWFPACPVTAASMSAPASRCALLKHRIAHFISLRLKLFPTTYGISPTRIKPHPVRPFIFHLLKPPVFFVFSVVTNSSLNPQGEMKNLLRAAQKKARNAKMGRPVDTC